MKKIIILSCGIFLMASAIQVRASEEDWYSYWSVGISDNTYPQEIQNVYDDAQNLGFNRLQTSIDAFGFYWPITSSNTINGFVVNGADDTLSLNGSNISLKTYLYSYSFIHFFGEEPGDGFYLRADVGLARGVVTTSTANGSLSGTSDWGNGFLLGVGYGIPVSSESRVILGLSIANKTIEDLDYTTTMFSIGGLW